MAVAATLAGCPWHARSPAPLTTEGEWGMTRDRATRRALLYDGLQHRATATATHLSMEVREARARRLAAWLDWSAGQLEERLAEERTRAAESEEFLLSFYTADPEANDLDAPDRSWTLTVKAEEQELKATRVTSKDDDVTLRGLFPFVGHFETVYLVTFPRMATGDLAGRSFTFDLASALGRVTLDYGLPGKANVQEPVQAVP